MVLNGRNPAVVIGRDGAHVVVDQAIPLSFVLNDWGPPTAASGSKKKAALGPGP